MFYNRHVRLCLAILIPRNAHVLGISEGRGSSKLQSEQTHEVNSPTKLIGSRWRRLTRIKDIFKVSRSRIWWIYFVAVPVALSASFRACRNQCHGQCTYERIILIQRNRLLAPEHSSIAPALFQRKQKLRSLEKTYSPAYEYHAVFLARCRQVDLINRHRRRTIYFAECGARRMHLHSWRRWRHDWRCDSSVIAVPCQATPRMPKLKSH